MSSVDAKRTNMNSHRMARANNLHHIHRVDDVRSRSYAWVVVVQRLQKTTIRRFADGKYGGKRVALRAAIHFRDTVLKMVQDNQYPLWRRNRKRRNNTSGTVGVGRYVSREGGRRGVIERISWQAFWDDPDGRRRGRKFSVNVHGERQAKDLAHRAREDALRAMFKK